jgi:haloacid dehalogenase superfamily, subfamily IA, variant 1 with third motif having Dx(3-4)D or Dx(3-4)E
VTGPVPTGYDAVVFDNDGVVVEPTDPTHIVDAVRETFLEFGHEPSRERVRRLVETGAGPVETVGDSGLDADLEAFWRRREDLAAAAQTALVREGGKPLYDDVTVLDRLEARTGMVSNNQAETVAFIVDHYGLDWFETVYGREPTVAGARRRKPDPHYLERALSDLGARNALYVGDSDVDVLAADRAGVDSAFLRREHRADADLPVEPTYEVPDLHALVDALAATV